MSNTTQRRLKKEKTKWSFDNLQSEQSKLSKYPGPPGFKEVYAKENSSSGSATSAGFDNNRSALVAKKKSKAMQVAMSPGKQMGMNAFMLYMSGKQLNMFSISITTMAIMNPLKSIMGTHKTFEQFEEDDGAVDLQMPKLIFFALNVVWLAIGMYKMSSMRLLPTTSADWVGYIVWKDVVENGLTPVQSGL